VNYSRRRCYNMRGLMTERITKRHAVALPRRFSASFRRLVGLSARLPLWRLTSARLLCFNSRPIEPGSLPGGPVEEASER
jgi:hypothetical protein